MFKKIPSKYANFVMPLILSTFMTLIVSGIATFKHVGINDHTFPSWMSAWMTAFPIAFPALLCILPLVKKIVGRIVEQPN